MFTNYDYDFLNPTHKMRDPIKAAEIDVKNAKRKLVDRKNHLWEFSGNRETLWVMGLAAFMAILLWFIPIIAPVICVLIFSIGLMDIAEEKLGSIRRAEKHLLEAQERLTSIEKRIRHKELLDTIRQNNNSSK